MPCVYASAGSATRIGHWLITLLALLHTASLGAVEPRPLNEYFRETWTTRQGLPHNLILAIAQTPDGYLWFGTWEGLSRYNGVEFKTFSRVEVPELRDNGIRALRVASDGTLWMGTSRGGVTRYKDGHWNTLTTHNGLAQDEIMDVLDAGSGRLWVATESAGLTRLENGKARSFHMSDGLPSEALMSLAAETDGTIWVGTTEGLARIRGDNVEAFGQTQGLPVGPVLSVHVAADGVLYVGTEKGVYRRVAMGFERLSPDIPEDAVPRLLMDRSGALWVGTVTYGVLRWQGGRVDRFNSLASLPNNRISALIEDHEGSVWVGTNGGLLRLRDAPFGSYTTEHGLSDDYVRTVLDGADGALWVGTSRGLSLLRNGKFEVLDHGDGLPGDSILSLSTARAGGVWVGTYSNGLARWDGGIRQTLTTAHGLAGNQVRTIKEARDGTLWVGTSRGLTRFRDGKAHNFGVSEGLPREFIIGLHEASDGKLWVGTANGAATIEGDTIRTFDLKQMDDAEDVFGFHEDRDGTMWLATDRGLVRHRSGQLHLVGRKQGLPVETIFQVVADQSQNFWLSSNRGVIRITHADADAVADGRQSTLSAEVFGEGDGMASAQCNGGSNPAAAVSRDGRVWVATAKGLSVVAPAQLSRFARADAPVVIEEVRVDDKVLAPQDTLLLPAGTRRMELHFAGLSYLMPQKIRYRYLLEGFDNEWIDRGTLRFAQFTNLAPGRYHFRVSAANPGGGWNPQEASLHFEIRPFLWQRPLFWAALAMLGLCAMLLAYRWRTHALRANERRLRELVEQRTLDLREQSERLYIANEEKSRLLERLREQAEMSERQAREDALTGLANRRHFDERLADEFARACRDRQPLCLALLDIDHFKRINDSYSHAIGDAALKAVADVMRMETRGSDVVARYGGEEFALLFPRTALEEALGLMERLRAAVVNCDFSAFAADLKVTVSIGVSDREGLAHHERMVSRADTRLYEAKRLGRNRVCG